MSLGVVYAPEFIRSERTYELYLLACANAGCTGKPRGARVSRGVVRSRGIEWRYQGSTGDSGWLGGREENRGLDAQLRAGSTHGGTVSGVGAWRSGTVQCGRGDQGASTVGFCGGSSGGDAVKTGGGSVSLGSAASDADCRGRGRDPEGGVASPGTTVRGPNWERNNKWREKKRQAKARREALGSNSSVDLTPVERDGTNLDGQGFWRSCTVETRQQLIESKARMHIAENERRARKARLEVERMNAPVAILEEAMRHVKLAQRCAKEKGDSKVAGWAETVANSYAESVARSAPSTIPSYASVASAATSVSVDGSARIKPGTVAWFKKRIGALTTLDEMYVVYGELERAYSLTAPEHHQVDLMLDACRDRLTKKA